MFYYFYGLEFVFGVSVLNKIDFLWKKLKIWLFEICKYYIRRKGCIRVSLLVLKFDCILRLFDWFVRMLLMEDLFVFVLFYVW